MTTIGTCPACGYPKFGPGLCAFCLPVQALTGDYSFESTAGAVQPQFLAAGASRSRHNKLRLGGGSDQVTQTG
jgi:hypothetical protein